MNKKDPNCIQCNELKKEIKKLKNKLITHRQIKHNEGVLK